MPRHRIEPAPERTVVALEYVSKPIRGLSTRTAVRVVAGKDSIIVRGANTSHALRRAALAIEMRNAVGDLEKTEPRRVAMSALQRAIVAMRSTMPAGGAGRVQAHAAIADAAEAYDALRRDVGWDINELGDLV